MENKGRVLEGDEKNRILFAILMEQGYTERDACLMLQIPEDKWEEKIALYRGFDINNVTFTGDYVPLIKSNGKVAEEQ